MEFCWRRELLVGSRILVADAIEQFLEPWFAPRRGSLDVEESNFAFRQMVLFLQSGNVHRRCDPAVTLPIDPDENVALGQVRSVEFTWRIGACSRFKEHWGQTQSGDR